MPQTSPDQLALIKSQGMLDQPGNKTYLMRLRQNIPDVKLLFVVRNPIERVISEFAVGAHKGNTMPDIDEVIMNRTEHFTGMKINSGI